MLWLLISFGKVERLFVFTVISAGPWLEWSAPITRVMFFLIYPKHCKTDCDLSVPLTAIVYMIDYTEDYESPPSKMMSPYSIHVNISRNKFGGQRYH